MMNQITQETSNAKPGLSRRPHGIPPEHSLASIVILNYNYGEYLRQCIESALSQGYQPLEVIVVDDGSTDDSESVLASFGKRILVSRKQNGGMVSAMNHGFGISQGSVVIFLDADDYLLPGAVSAHAQALRDCEVVRSQTYLTVVHGTRTSSTERMPAKRVAEGDLRQLTLQRGPGAYVSPPNSGNAWSRNFLEQVFPLPEDLKAIGAETFLMDTAPLFGKIVTLKHLPRAAYRFHNANMNGKLAAMKLENVTKVIAQHEIRAAHLEKVAAARGFDAQASKWKAGNWRLLTLDYLYHRLTRSGTPPGWMEHMASAFRVSGSFLKWLALACIILAIRATPRQLSLLLAGQFIKLRYM
jgi:glycosyltransferase involved in cell wall biosynthesis